MKEEEKRPPARSGSGRSSYPSLSTPVATFTRRRSLLATEEHPDWGKIRRNKRGPPLPAYGRLRLDGGEPANRRFIGHCGRSSGSKLKVIGRGACLSL